MYFHTKCRRSKINLITEKEYNLFVLDIKELIKFLVKIVKTLKKTWEDKII